MLDHCQTDGFIRSKIFSVSAGLRKNYFIHHAIFHCIMKYWEKISVIQTMRDFFCHAFDDNIDLS